MEKLINRILVPFHRWKEADGVIRQAIELANQMRADLHLLHLGNRRLRDALDALDATDEPDMRQYYSSLLDPNLTLTIACVQGTTERPIIGYCRKFNIDLLFFPGRTLSFQGFLRPFFPVNLNLLLKRVKCPVLKIAPGPHMSAMKNIVLSIGDYLPVRKLLFATYLAKRSHSTIHLVSVEKSESADNMERSYRLLRENTDLPVECRMFPGQRLAEAAWSHAKSIQADLILIQSGRESYLSGILHAFTNRHLFSASRISVMTLP